MRQGFERQFKSRKKRQLFEPQTYSLQCQTNLGLYGGKFGLEQFGSENVPKSPQKILLRGIYYLAKNSFLITPSLYSKFWPF